MTIPRLRHGNGRYVFYNEGVVRGFVQHGTLRIHHFCIVDIAHVIKPCIGQHLGVPLPRQFLEIVLEQPRRNEAAAHDGRASHWRVTLAVFLRRTLHCPRYLILHLLS